MRDLDFQVRGVRAVPHAAAPTLAFALQVTQPQQNGRPPAPIHSAALHCQIRLEPNRRHYSPQEQSRLFELFGESSRWSQTVRSMLWTSIDLPIGSFTDQATVDLPVGCTWDFNIATTKYFDALAAGFIPIRFLFSGTLFYAGDNGALQVGRIPWEKEAEFQLPVSAWRQMMDLYYPNSAWLCLRKDIFDRLRQYKTRSAQPTWEQALETLLSRAEEAAAL